MRMRMRMNSRALVVAVLAVVVLVAVTEASQQKTRSGPKVIHFPMKRVDFGENDRLQELYSFTSSHNRFKELRKADSQLPDLPLGGSISLLPTGAYFVEVGVGTPSQPILALLDSGSNDFLVTTTGCVGCNKPATTEYNIGGSSTVSKLTCDNGIVTCPACDEDVCEFLNEYITCAPNNPDQVCILKGPILRDVFSVDEVQVPVYFGAITFMNITFPGPISAIWGVAASRNYTAFNETGPLEGLYQAGLIEHDAFSVCILQENGTFTLGGADPAFFEGNMEWTPITSGEAFVVETVDMQVNGQSLGFPASMYNMEGGSVVDTGTYSLVVPTPVYDAIGEAIAATCPDSNLVGVCGLARNDSIIYNGECFTMTDAQIEAFPPLGITFGGNVTILVDGYGYLVPNVTDPTCYAWGLQDGGPNSLVLHGDVVLKNKYVTFDKSSMQLGWASNINLNACQQGHP